MRTVRSRLLIPLILLILGGIAVDWSAAHARASVRESAPSVASVSAIKSSGYRPCSGEPDVGDSGAKPAALFSPLSSVEVRGERGAGPGPVDLMVWFRTVGRIWLSTLYGVR